LPPDDSMNEMTYADLFLPTLISILISI